MFKINGKIKPQKFNLVKEARAEIERLRSESEVTSWNILTEESAVLETKGFGNKWQMSLTEKLIILFLLLLIIGSAVVLWQRRPQQKLPTHFVAPQMVNYRNENGDILGQLPQGVGVICQKIIGNKCQILINKQQAYIYLNVLKPANEK
mgnify:CR=1 FL=1